MKNKIKMAYESPETEIIQVRTNFGLLQASGGEYPNWEEENI